MSDSLEERVAEFIELREAGEQVSPGAFAARFPEMESRLLVSLGRLKQTEDLFPRASTTPETVGPWTVEREIGRGGMGRVLLVHRTGGEEGAANPERKRFALKVLNPQLAFDSRSIARIQREGELLQRLNHPCLVRIEDSGTESGAPWIAMEYVEGTALSDLLSDARRLGRKPPLLLSRSAIDDESTAWSALAAFGARIAEAAEEAHRAGLVHRDIKPSNVIVREDGSPVLIDFGLAAADSSATLTRTGDLLGTPQYMAPEQARGERSDARTDIWSLGATLYECATLRSPVPESEPLTVIAWLRKHRPRRLADSTSSLLPGQALQVARVIDRALAFRSKRRFSSMEAFADRLRSAALGEGASTGSASPVELIEDRLRAAPKAAVVSLAGGVLLAGAWAIASVAAAGKEPSGEHSIAASSVADRWLRAGTTAYLARDRSEWRRCADEAANEAGPGSLGAERAAILRAAGDPELLPETFRDPGLAGLANGLRAYRGGDHDGAIDAFRTAAQRAGTWMLPLVLLGEAAWDAGDLGLCEREWTAVVRVLPDSPHLYRRLGKVRRSRGDQNGAIRAFRRAEELEPEDWRNVAELARALLSTGDPEARRESLAVVDRAVELCDSPTPSLLNVKAAILDTEDRREEARQLYREVLERDPNHFWSHFNLAYSFSLDCRLSESREAYENAIRLRPDSAEAQFSLAHLAAGAEAPTCVLCEEAIQRDPDLLDPDRALHHLKLSLEAGGRSLDWLPKAAAELALRLDRVQPVSRALEALLAESESVDQEAVRLERALRILDH